MIDPSWTIWECAAGEGLLARGMDRMGLNVTPTDIENNFGVGFHSFFDWSPDEWDVIITNPPFSMKYPWLGRCFELGKPFALLMPVETMGSRTWQDLFEEHGGEVILFHPRVDFKMPNRGWDGAGAHFPTAWFTWGFNVGSPLTVATVTKRGPVDLQFGWESLLGAGITYK